MKTKRFPLILVIILLLVALAGVGVAYGMWAETLTIEGTIYTGDVDAEWTSVGCMEFHTWPDLPNEFADLGEFEGKDVGSVDWLIDGDVLQITINNGYPSYAIDCDLLFTYTGSIPAYIRGNTISAVSPNLTNCTVAGNPQEKKLLCDQLTAWFVDGTGAQIHDGYDVASKLFVHVEQPASELDTYQFEVGICMSQWNEPATADQCFANAPVEP